MVCILIGITAQATPLPRIEPSNVIFVEYLLPEYKPETIINDFYIIKNRHGNSVLPLLIEESPNNFKDESGKSSLLMGGFGLFLLVFLLL